MLDMATNVHRKAATVIQLRDARSGKGESLEAAIQIRDRGKARFTMHGPLCSP